MPHPALVDMTRKTVGQLTVIERYVDPNSKTGSARWLCKCSCGGTCVVRGSQLRLAEKDGHDSACPECRKRREGQRPPRVYRKRSKGKIPKICKICSGLPHRVRGPTCRACGLPYHPEPWRETLERRR